MAHIVAAALAVSLFAAGSAMAQEPVKVGLITPITGQFASTGLEMKAGAELFMRQHGAEVAGRKVELIVKDDQAIADITKRIATELVVNEKVSFLAGMGLTPLALAAAQVATKSQVPLITMGAATPSIPQASPYIVRTSWNLGDAYRVLIKWAVDNEKVKSVVTIVADYAPGYDVEKIVAESMSASGGKVLDALRAPVFSPNYTPLIQRAADAKPDAIIVFVPAGSGPTFLRQYAERGFDKSSIRLLATGDVLDDQLMDTMGPAAVGLVSAYHYSDAHDSALNRTFTKGVEDAEKFRANMMGVGGYDGMQVIYKALEATKGSTDAQKLLEAMKGMSWESPAGPARINPNTRDIEHTLYLRRAEMRGGRLVNAEFQSFPAGTER